MAKVNITDTILRDAHQSQAATRMKTSEMLEIADRLDKIGYWSLEVWGGATFDSCLRFLNEDPWVRLRKLREAMPNTKLQMLLRGQNILGYKHYADDVVDSFVKKAVDNGIDIIRTFDALNDIRNLESSIKATKKYGAHCEAAFCYTTSPVHTSDYFVEMAIKLEKMGADTICIKDMANILLPFEAYKLVKNLKQAVSVPIHLHTHNTSGTGSLIYLKGIEAGVDIVDTALSPLGSGTAQPATEPLVATLQGTEYDTGLDLIALNDIAKSMKGTVDRLKAEGYWNPKVMKVDINTLLTQIPGGMLSNLISQLEKQGMSDKWQEVMAEVPKVREDFGFPPLVTPTSQIVGTQAVLNVKTGERYKMISKESKALLSGEYGELPGKVNPEIKKLAIGDKEPISCRPADLIEPELEKYKKEASAYAECEEDVLSYAVFPQVAPKYFEFRNASKYKVDASLAEGSVHPV